MTGVIGVIARAAGQLTHLVLRFFTSVFALPPRPAEEAWVDERLGDGEFALWAAQPRYDRRHTLRVARRVDRLLTARGDRDDWVAAALLHDVGKIEARLGVVGRSVATLVGGVVGRRRMAGWRHEPGLRGRFGRYAAHGEIGGELVRGVGGREAAARWAEVHHLVGGRNPLKPDDVPVEVVTALKLSDRA